MTMEAEELKSLRFSCICSCSAELEEPLLILQAQDILAPRVVVRWAHLAGQAGSPQDKGRGPWVLAKEMADWQAKNP
jgi:hypothetical protein